MKPGERCREEIEAFYRRDHEKLWRSLLGYTGDPDLASEAESEALTQAIRRGDAIDDPAAWIWRTAYRIAAGLLADRRTDQATTTSLAGSGSGAAAAQRAAVTDQPLVETLALLSVLTPQQKAVVTLRYVAGLTPTAIAEVLDTSAATVRVQLHRAHHTLRQTWSDR